MQKVLVLYPKGQDPKKFRPYYETKHIPLAKSLPGLLRCHYTYDVKSTPGAEPPYFCIFEAEFADEAAMIGAMTSATGQKVAADAPNFATIPPIVINYQVKE